MFEYDRLFERFCVRCRQDDGGPTTFYESISVTKMNFESLESQKQQFISQSADETFEIAESFGERLIASDTVLLFGDLGAGKTLFTKGILNSLDYNIDEVTSPSFTLVNLYKTQYFNVYHIDFWRLGEDSDVAFAVGLDEIFDEENSIVIAEWADKLGECEFPGRVFEVKLVGDGDEPRKLEIFARR